MTNSLYEYDGSSRFPIKTWTKGVPFDDNTRQQLRKTALLPFIHKHVAAMPDAHFGKGATVGSVIATRKAVVPSSVGLDGGCGMSAVRLDLTADRLPDDLAPTRHCIERAIPHGGPGIQGSWLEPGRTGIPSEVSKVWKQRFDDRYEAILERHPGARSRLTLEQLGSLGGGNHFIEVCLDEQDRVWVMLHSGSRGLGNKMGSYFIDQAKELMEKMHIDLPDKDLAYLPQGIELFDDYWNAMMLVQEFAKANRDIMMNRIIASLRKAFPSFAVTDEAINCHHNYVDIENHFSENVFVTRKGAVRARKKDLGIIPGSMATGSFIVRGKGNKDSFCSCSHGAGRVMSRSKAKRLISEEDHKKAMEGIEARTDAGVLDESPAAYKNLGSVMEAQKDLVEVLYYLRQIVNVKG